MKVKGAVLKIKSGYNPNSSSIGTEISVFLWGAAGYAVLVNVLLSLAYIIRLRPPNKRNRPEAPGNNPQAVGGP